MVPGGGPLPPRWGYDQQVYGWTPDGEKVLFRSLRDTNGAVETKLYTVPRTGGLPQALPMPNSGAADFSPDGSKMVYSPLFRDFRHWKRYQGGWAQDLYIFDLANYDVEPVSHTVRTERDPMWIGDKIYFASDRDDRLNLYSFDPNGGAVEQLTSSDLWDVRWPSTDNESRIVYELDGQLHILDVTNGADQAIVVTVPDDGLWKRPRRISVAGNISAFDVSPKGERAVLAARGEVFTVPVEKGPTRNLTRSSGANDRSATWSPDGKNIAYISDASGEDEIWIVDQAGKGEAKKISSGHEAQLRNPLWSPDSSRIAFSDKDGKLFVVTVADGAEVEVADDIFGALFDYQWAPDSGHLAFSLNNEAGMSRVFIWSVSGGEPRQVTSDLFDSYTPAWGTEGDYLFFISERHYVPQISDLEWNYAGNQRDGVYALALRKDVKPLFPPESDEVEIEEEKAGDAEEEKEEKKDKKGDAAEKKEETKAVVIDFDGLGERLMRVPVGPDNITAIAAIKGHLLYSTSGANFYGRSNGDTRKLHIYSLEDRKGSEIVKSGLRAWVVSADGKKVLARTSKGIELVDAKMKGGEAKGGFDRGSRDEPGADRGVGGNLRGGVAPLPRLLLCREHARLRLGGAARAVPSAARARVAPLRPQLRAHRDGGRAQLRSHVHLGRRFRDSRPRTGRSARSALRARRGNRALPDREDLPRPQRRVEVPFAAHRGGGGRQGWRLRARDRRHRAEGR